MGYRCPMGLCGLRGTRIAVGLVARFRTRQASPDRLSAREFESYLPGAPGLTDASIGRPRLLRAQIRNSARPVSVEGPVPFDSLLDSGDVPICADVPRSSPDLTSFAFFG